MLISCLLCLGFPRGPFLSGFLTKYLYPYCGTIPAYSGGTEQNHKGLSHDIILARIQVEHLLNVSESLPVHPVSPVAVSASSVSSVHFTINEH
jgi:hypothetical protein